MKVLSLLLLIGISHTIAGEEGYFAVIGSDMLKPGENFKGTLNYQCYSVEKTLQIAVTKKGEDGTPDTHLSAKNITFTGTGSSLFEFEVRIKKETRKVFKLSCCKASK